MKVLLLQKDISLTFYCFKLLRLLTYDKREIAALVAVVRLVVLVLSL